MLKGTNLTHTKEFNLRIVIETIRLYGPVSRADVARMSQLTPQTVSNLVRELIQMNLVIEVDRYQSGRGAPSVRLAVNPDGAFSIGLDLDRDHLNAVLVDLSGTVRQRVMHALDFPSPAESLKLMCDTVEKLISKEGINKSGVCGVGVGVPGPMHLADDGQTYLINPRDFGDWQDVPLSAMLENGIGLPVLLENNASAAAVGERWYGDGRHMTSFFYVYFGSGLGGGLIVNGHPVEGATGNAAEIGYLPTSLDARENTGDLPHIGQHFNLPRLYRRLAKSGAVAGTPDDLRALFLSGNPALMKWIEEAARHITMIVLSVEYLLDPAAIFFGGRLADEILQAIMQRVRENVPRLRFDQGRTSPEYRIGTAGLDAAALGVATLPIYQLFSPLRPNAANETDASGARSFSTSLPSPHTS